MGMPTGPLSSNWELLRQRLQASKPPKRKPEDDTAAATQHRKVSSNPPNKKLKRQNTRSDAHDATTNSKPKIAKSNAHTLRKLRSMSTLEQPKNSTSTISSLALWATDNNIPAADLARAYNLPLTATTAAMGELPTKAGAAVPTTVADPELAANSAKGEVGKYIAIDCEMVGVGEGDRESSALARVSVVNFFGHCVLDCFVKPKERVTDWRTWVSGVSPKDMANALTFEVAQKKVAELMDGRILVGHAIKNDLECLLISHPRRDIRDTSRHPGFRKGRTPALKKLAKEILGIDIQGGSHSSVEDARVCMLLYRQFKDDFERENQIHFPNHAKKSTRGKKSAEAKKRKNKK